jgi:hypothetical protein
VTDVLEWTDEGRAALASYREKSLRDVPEAELRARIAAVVERWAPCWQRGAKDPNCDEAGREAIVLARTFTGSTELAIDTAARVLSLLGSRREGDVGAYTELLLRAKGYERVFRVLVAMWEYKTDSNRPIWFQDSELAIWLRRLEPDDKYAQDASVSFAKGDVARYLHARMREEDRAEVDKALDEVWPTAPLEARVALALAADSAERAAEITRDLLAKKTSSYPHFGWECLPYVVRDIELVGRIPYIELRVSLLFLAVHGAAALPFYEKALASERNGVPQRARLLGELMNVRGPKTAKLFSAFAKKRPHGKTVKAYFARYRELRPLSGPAPSSTATRGSKKPSTGTARGTRGAKASSPGRKPSSRSGGRARRARHTAGANRT